MYMYQLPYRPFGAKVGTGVMWVYLPPHALLVHMPPQLPVNYHVSYAASIMENKFDQNLDFPEIGDF